MAIFDNLTLLPGFISLADFSTGGNSYDTKRRAASFRHSDPDDYNVPIDCDCPSDDPLWGFFGDGTSGSGNNAMQRLSVAISGVVGVPDTSLYVPWSGAGYVYEWTAVFGGAWKIDILGNGSSGSGNYLRVVITDEPVTTTFFDSGVPAAGYPQKYKTFTDGVGTVTVTPEFPADAPYQKVCYAYTLP